MEALLRYPKHMRRAKAQEWARRSNAVQQSARMQREPDFETMRKRALRDARGTVLREGTTYTATGVTHWQVRRSVSGRTDQFDLVADGKVVRTCGQRRMPKRFRPC
jgi:hypothetical protein